MPAVTTTLTPQQAQIREAAQALLTALEAVPDSTMDWRVEEGRNAVKHLLNAGQPLAFGGRWTSIATADAK
jgi:hypothetical protein